MHKCINNTVGNLYHLEQMVDNFFPYSQKQLGFNKPATVIFQSDEDNASRMLGKTAYYNPESLEVVLYTDNRHPKDVMRSLSHELVHHAQNCRGDFTNSSSTYAGYAQEDPHLRKMEREAYTKGNLIFRDFEDLIKTGKINIEIDFSDSGEPKMSLKEWKNDEINTKLMKKWGYLNESKLKEAGPGDEHYQFDKKEREAELEEGHEHGPECGCPDQELEEGNAGDWSKIADEDDPTDLPPGNPRLDKIEMDDADETEERRSKVNAKKSKGHVRHSGGPRWSNSASTIGVGGVVGENAGKKISVKEAKQITRRIIERIKLENK